MSHSLFDTLTESSGCLTVQQLLDSSLNHDSVATDQTKGDGFLQDEEDLFQCGRCKSQFSSLDGFLLHKRNQCAKNESNSLSPESTEIEKLEKEKIESNGQNAEIDHHSQLDHFNIEEPDLSCVLQSSSDYLTQAVVVNSKGEVINLAGMYDPPVLKLENLNESEVLQDPPLISSNKKTKFTCQFCRKNFSKRFDLIQHIRSHTGERPFQCPICGRSFAQKSNVKKHMGTHKVWPKGSMIDTLPKDPIKTIYSTVEGCEDGNEPPSIKEEVFVDNSYVCPFCSIAYDSYIKLRTHMKVHKDQKVYACRQRNCSDSFVDMDSFLNHMRLHENDLQFRCHDCIKIFKSLKELSAHQFEHSIYPNQGKKKGPRYFRCTKCLNKYASFEALDHHLRTASHNFPCHSCMRVFNSERLLRRHLYTHGSVEPFSCATCQKSFKSDYSLKTHQLTHTGERPYECSECQAAFNRKDKLKRHSLVHQVKGLICPFRDTLGCKREFRRRDKLRLHIASHINRASKRRPKRKEKGPSSIRLEKKAKAVEDADFDESKKDNLNNIKDDVVDSLVKNSFCAISTENIDENKEFNEITDNLNNSNFIFEKSSLYVIKLDHIEIDHSDEKNHMLKNDNKSVPNDTPMNKIDPNNLDDEVKIEIWEKDSSAGTTGNSTISHLVKEENHLNGSLIHKIEEQDSLNLQSRKLRPSDKISSSLPPKLSNNNLVIYRAPNSQKCFMSTNNFIESFQKLPNQIISMDTNTVSSSGDNFDESLPEITNENISIDNTQRSNLLCNNFDESLPKLPNQLLTADSNTTSSNSCNNFVESLPRLPNKIISIDITQKSSSLCNNFDESLPKLPAQLIAMDSTPRSSSCINHVENLPKITSQIIEMGSNVNSNSLCTNFVESLPKLPNQLVTMDCTPSSSSICTNFVGSLPKITNQIISIDNIAKDMNKNEYIDSEIKDDLSVDLNEKNSSIFYVGHEQSGESVNSFNFIDSCLRENEPIQVFGCDGQGEKILISKINLTKL